MKWYIFTPTWQSFLKSRFLKLLLGSFLSILLVSSPMFAFSSPKQEIRGVWLTTNDTNTLLDRPKLQEAIDQLARLNFNTLYPVVWNSGYALYPSQVAQQAGIQTFIHKGLQGQDPLADLITQAHNRGLLVLPWFEFGFMTPPTSELATNHPQWLTKKRDGGKTTISAAGEVVWLNPFHPQVQQFMINLVIEVMNLYDVDGIQFDDHLSLPSDLGYDAYTVNLYKQETKKYPPANPKDEAWVRWRANKLTAFVSRLNQAIKAKKSQAIFSISPNPYPIAYNSYLQDWLTWVRQDLIDELIVQVYRPDLPSFVRELTRPEIQEVRQKIPTGIGILTGLRNRPIEMKFIQDKTLAARQQGLGISFFFYDSLWNYAPESPAERQARFLALFSYPTPRKLIENPTSIGNPTLTENPTSIGNPTLTENPTSIGNPTLTENPTSTGNPTLTENPTSTGNPTLTENPTSTGNPTLTENPTSIKDPSFIENPSPYGY